ncbi:MAG TPA: methylated-DNA--[protein]-cysteine S-methyltransferase, partial [Candidatus Binataceae bacterium]|nr:methylated-DNA--[protein]-cysteine S-methyltransferase [Candidatus Binataceae bacterium]
RRGVGFGMNYTVIQSPLGRMLIATTDKGIAWLGFGDSDVQAIDEIRSDFADIELTREDAACTRYAKPLLAFLERKAPFPSLPLDVIGTPFQRAVWDELCAIPTGTTRSYGDIARRIGRADAPRATGAAVGANPVSILIPCHRALASDGSLHNYRYGLARKRMLLELEGATFRAPRIQQSLAL